HRRATRSESYADGFIVDPGHGVSPAVEKLMDARIFWNHELHHALPASHGHQTVFAFNMDRTIRRQHGTDLADGPDHFTKHEAGLRGAVLDRHERRRTKRCREK